jgi:hypothetical protein
VDDCQCGNITKLKKEKEKETLVGTLKVQSLVVEHIGNRQQMKNKMQTPPLKNQKKKTKPTYDIIHTMKELV